MPNVSTTISRRRLNVSRNSPTQRWSLASAASPAFCEMVDAQLVIGSCRPVATGLQEPITSCASTISQKAGEAALASDQRCVGEFRDTFKRRRDIVVDTFGNTGLLPVVPHGAFYALIDIASTGRNSVDFAKAFLLAHDTAVVPGITFGPSCDRYVRVAFTIDDAALREGLTRLRRYIEQGRAPH